MTDGVTDYLSWPGLTHVWHMKKTVAKDGETKTTESVGIVRLPKHILGERAIAEAVSEYIRGHWGIETSLHGKRDTSFGEDRSMIRKGHAPQTMAILRNIVTSIFHRGTVRNFKSAMRKFAADPTELFEFLGLITATQPAIAA